jgi:hypothetical protein
MSKFHCGTLPLVTHVTGTERFKQLKRCTFSTQHCDIKYTAAPQKSLFAFGEGFSLIKNYHEYFVRGFLFFVKPSCCGVNM